MKKYIIFSIFPLGLAFSAYADDSSLDSRPIISLEKAEQNLGYCIIPKIQYGEYWLFCLLSG